MATSPTSRFELDIITEPCPEIAPYENRLNLWGGGKRKQATLFPFHPVDSGPQWCYAGCMPRTARMVVPRVPYHITQRGNRREDVIFCDGDRKPRVMEAFLKHHVRPRKPPRLRKKKREI